MPLHAPAMPSSQLHISYISRQSHLPSFQPVRHLSSHFPQSKVGFPSLTLTSLCASQSHLPNSSLLLALTPPTFVMYSWKSSAHTQQGYSFENRPIKDVTLLWSVRVGFVGYCAAIECRSVQDERPSSSTSGGHSDRLSLLDVAAAPANPAAVKPDIVDRNEDRELHVRQLQDMSAEL